MKISLNWLKEYIRFDLTPDEVGVHLTNCGLEVEGIEDFESVKGGLRGLVIGEVLTCEDHPDSDHLHITTVNVGQETPLNIVCGASNVAAGQKVVVACIGATLYSDNDSFTIKKSKIRGVPSEGMICAEDEIGLGNSHEGIMVLDESAEPGTPASQYFNIEKDYVFEIGLTPNRSDAMSHFGVAQELYAVLSQNKIPCTLISPKSYDFIPNAKKNLIDITIENKQDCPRYTGLTFENITVKESPDWLKNRLRSIGIRPINNVVDITQFVMFELGQPLHAFDADFITSNKVIIKNLPEGTPFTTLDGAEIKLSAEDLMICNDSEGMCIAGVYGGQNSGVTEKTKNLFLESAYFNPKSVRKTSKRHHLKTDAAFRYERGCDPENTVLAIRRAANLIQELTGAHITSEIVDLYPNRIEPCKVLLSLNEVNQVAGKEIGKNEISNILLLLGMEVAYAGDDQLMVTIPSNRVDVTRPVDLIEEILRIYGYNNIEIPSQISYQLNMAEGVSKQKMQNIVSTYLINNGFYETMNTSLTKGAYVDKFDFLNKEETVFMLNPLSSELNVMRQTLLFSGLENIIHNFNNRNFNLRLFEFGRTYHKISADTSKDVTERFVEKQQMSLFVTGKNHEDDWNKASSDLDFFYLKNIIYNVLEKMNFPIEELTCSSMEGMPFTDNLVWLYGETPVIKAGRVHPSILKSFDIKKDVYFAEFEQEILYSCYGKKPVEFKAIPIFPAVKRDIALVVDKHITYATLENIAYKYGSKLLKSVSLFDVYEGDKIENGKKSYALNFVLQHHERTLTDEEINKVMNKLINAFEKEVDGKLR